MFSIAPRYETFPPGIPCLLVGTALLPYAAGLDLGFVPEETPPPVWPDGEGW